MTHASLRFFFKFFYIFSLPFFIRLTPDLCAVGGLQLKQSNVGGQNIISPKSKYQKSTTKMIS